MRNLKAYVASPYGFSESTRSFYDDVFLNVIRKCGIEIIDPWTLTPLGLIDNVMKMPPGPAQIIEWKKVNRIIGENNVLGIDACDMMVAALDGADVDSGTASEIGYGSAMGKPIVGYRQDFRITGDNVGTIVNLQVEEFIFRSGGNIACNLDELKKSIEHIKERILHDMHYIQK